MREIWLTSSMALFWNFPLFCNFPLMICNFPLFSFFNIRIADRTWNWQLSNVLIYALILSLRVCVYFDFENLHIFVSFTKGRYVDVILELLLWFLLHLPPPWVLVTMWLTRNHMFSFVKFWINYPRSFFEILKSPSFHSGDFKISKNWTREIYPKFPSQTCDY